jgi:hypothetical protein
MNKAKEIFYRDSIVYTDSDEEAVKNKNKYLEFLSGIEIGWKKNLNRWNYEEMYQFHEKKIREKLANFMKAKAKPSLQLNQLVRRDEIKEDQ